MISASLWTFTFYSDNAEAESIRETLIHEGLSSKILQTSHSGSQNRIHAVCTIHHGEKFSDPVATAAQLELANNLGQRRLVDAYMFGGTRSGLIGLSRQKICGQWIAAALAIAERPDIEIDGDELRHALRSIKNARASGSEWEIKNLLVNDAISSIHRLNRSTGANLKFAEHLR